MCSMDEWRWWKPSYPLGCLAKKLCYCWRESLPHFTGSGKVRLGHESLRLGAQQRWQRTSDGQGYYRENWAHLTTQKKDKVTAWSRWINPTSLSTCQGKAGDQRIQGLMGVLECDLKPLCVVTCTLSRGLTSLLLPSPRFMTALKLKSNSFFFFVKSNSVLWNKNPKEIQFLSHMLVLWTENVW